MATYQDTMFLSPTYLKSISYLTNNVDEDTLGAAIREAQDIYLKEIIGEALYAKLQELVYNKITGSSGETIDTKTDYKLLLDSYIQPYLASQALVCTLMPLTYKLRNIGVSKDSDTNIQTASFNEVQGMITYYDTAVANYSTKLSQYLYKNKDKYAEVKNAKDAKLNKRFANTGLWLGEPALPLCNH